jgi:hypothetical protein
MKKLLPLLILPLLLAGCATTFTNLSSTRQVRNPNHLYPVEVALSSRQQTLRWESIKPFVNIGGEMYEMRPTKLMTNRWEALVPVPANQSTVHYRYKFDFKFNAMGKRPQPDSTTSPEYILRIVDGK